jgi:hypothetical protein
MRGNKKLNNKMHELLKYCGLDWLAVFLNLSSVYLLGNKNKWGFLTFISANIVWLLLGTMYIHSYGIIVGNSIFLVMNSRGFIKWNQNQKKIVVNS